ncbi:hypothetical protein [uncultured Mitsuokella sp.]|uniref:hypothetical protein n=1 Tax=uncultured Mitsuokella sp. TaxID=453120 RepID=UPI002596C7CF|nr:hypothetical protein [uncultured Mitsuokella sp.]
MGCHRGHHVGEVFDFDEDRGKICPMAMHCAFPLHRHPALRRHHTRSGKRNSRILLLRRRHHHGL